MQTQQGNAAFGCPEATEINLHAGLQSVSYTPNRYPFSRLQTHLVQQNNPEVHPPRA